MKAGRQLDRIIAEQIMGYAVSQVKRELYEAAPKGTRPLKAYSTEISAAWELVERFGMTLIPVEGGWFSFAGPSWGWKNPAEFLDTFQKADFVNSGAAVAESAPLSICIAALKASENRKPAPKADENPQQTVH